MFRKSHPERALARITEEARRAGTPELDWQKLEARLMQRIEAGPREASLRPAPRALFRARVLIPIAAVVAVLLLVLSRSGESGPLPAPTLAATALDGDDVAPERTLVATDRPLTVEHAGRAAWELSPGGAAAVIEHAGSVRIRLLRGGVRARVTPSLEPDRFVVEVGATRVAVHGTVFRVELRGDHAFVGVEEGVVAIGPSDRPHAPSRLLQAREEGTFTLDGRPITECAAPAGEKDPPRAATPRPTPAPSATLEAPSPASAKVVASSAPLEELTIGQVEAGVGAIVEGVTKCFERHTARTGDVRISARTTVTLDIAPEGSLTQVSFVPPLAPAAQSCSEEAVRRVRFAASAGGARVTRVLEFAR